MIPFIPFPVIETKHLILRRMELTDTDDVFEMRSNSGMHKYTDTKPDETRQETRAYIEKMRKGVDENQWIIWAIEHQQSKKVIGSINIWNIDIEKGTAELGYGIIPLYQGKGLMKEALLEVVKYGFEVMNLTALDAYTEENNINSVNLLENCQFKKIHRVDDEGTHNKKIYHMIVYRLKNRMR